MNHIKKLLLLSLLAITFLYGSCANKQGKTFTLSGTVIGKEVPKTVVLKYTKDTVEIADTVAIKNGKFQFSGKIDEPLTAAISLHNQVIWIEPAQMTIEINTDKSTAKLTGSKTQKDQDAFFQEIDVMSGTLRNLIEKMASVKDSIEKTNDKDTKRRLTALYDRLSVDRKQLDASDIQVRYIKENPKSFFSALLLFPLNSSEVIPVDTAINLYSRLSPNVQQSFWGKRINKDISLLNQNRPGNPAPDFEAKDPIRQSTLKLSDLRGKVVLMDFWAPWCGPCRRGFKYLKPLHNTYSAKGFEVIAVYTDKKEDRESWLKTIKDEDISTWHHVKIAENMLPNKATANDIRSKYYVQAIPHKVLIDRQGKMVKYWVGVSPNIEKEVEATVEKLMSE